MEIIYGTPTADPGATAKDEKDGDISNKIKSNWNTNVDLNNIGEYTVTYYVEDGKANSATATRKVIVKLNSSNYFGEYNTTWTVTGQGTYNNSISTISQGDSVNQFIIYPFRQADIHLKVNILGIKGDQFNFSQQDGGVLSEGSGTIVENGKIINLVFAMNNANGGTYTGGQILIKK